MTLMKCSVSKISFLRKSARATLSTTHQPDGGATLKSRNALMPKLYTANTWQGMPLNSYRRAIEKSLSVTTIAPSRETVSENVGSERTY
jgi:hypothetical protein